MHLYWKNLEMFIFLSSKATHIGLPYTYPRIFFLEFTGLFELKFHMEYSVDKTVNIILFLGNLIKMAIAHIWYYKICLDNKPKLTLTYFNIIKEFR